MELYSFVVILLALFGLAVGSFLNVCIYRLPRELSIIYPASHCPKCGNKLGAVDLIPVFSYVFLKGRCRFCRDSIPPRYPIVEITTALLFVLLFYQSGFTLKFLFMTIFAVLLVLITFSDLETQIIPDCANFIGIATGLMYGLIAGHILSSIIGMIIGGAFMYAVYWIGTAVYKKEAMGGGDIKFAMMLGAFFGWKNLVLALFLSFLVGAIVSLVVLAFKLKKRDEEIPFGPAMAAAAIIVMFFSNNIWRWYLGG